MKNFALAALAATLAACAATGPGGYSASTGDNFGYTDMRIEQNRYRVVYRGSAGMPPEIVEDYAMRRAAELTLENGYDWFRIIAREITHEERGGVSVGAGFGTGSYGRRSGVSVGVGGDLGRVGANDYFTARLEILMGEGDAPDEAEAYDASSVLGSVAGEGYGE